MNNRVKEARTRVATCMSLPPSEPERSSVSHYKLASRQKEHFPIPSISA